MKALKEANEEHIWEQELIQEWIQEEAKAEQDRLQAEARDEQELLQHNLMAEIKLSKSYGGACTNQWGFVQNQWGITEEPASTWPTFYLGMISELVSER